MELFVIYFILVLILGGGKLKDNTQIRGKNGRFK